MCQNLLLLSQCEWPSSLSRCVVCWSSTGFRFAPGNPRRFVWVISVSWVEIHASSCPVVSCPLDSHFSCASKQYWPEGQPLTHAQWIAVWRNRLWALVFPFNNHGHRDREVKQSSNCQPRQWSEKRGREREREIRVYKQTPCNKFVFSRCQVP